LATAVKNENNFYKPKLEESRGALQTGVDLIY